MFKNTRNFKPPKNNMDSTESKINKVLDTEELGKGTNTIPFEATQLHRKYRNSKVNFMSCIIYYVTNFIKEHITSTEVVT